MLSYQLSQLDASTVITNEDGCSHSGEGMEIQNGVPMRTIMGHQASCSSSSVEKMKAALGEDACHAGE